MQCSGSDDNDNDDDKRAERREREQGLMQFKMEKGRGSVPFKFKPPCVGSCTAFRLQDGTENNATISQHYSILEPIRLWAKLLMECQCSKLVIFVVTLVMHR